MKPEFKKLIKWVLVLIGILLIAFFLFIFIFAGETPRSADTKRIAETRQVSAALDLYKDENKVYPNSLEQLVPQYIGAMPLQPSNPNKYCTPEQLKYKYTLLPNNEFKLEYCLGDDIAENSKYKPGMNVIYSNGSSQ